MNNKIKSVIILVAATLLALILIISVATQSSLYNPDVDHTKRTEYGESSEESNKELMDSSETMQESEAEESNSESSEESETEEETVEEDWQESQEEREDEIIIMIPQESSTMEESSTVAEESATPEESEPIVDSEPSGEDHVIEFPITPIA